MTGAPLILPPDTEAYLIGYLSAALAGRVEPYCQSVAVSRDRDESPIRARSVTVRDDGGPQIDATRWLRRVGVNVLATSEAEAKDLANMVTALIVACPDGRPCVKARQTSGPYAVPDASGQPLRYLTAELTVRGTAADATP